MFLVCFNLIILKVWKSENVSGMSVAKCRGSWIVGRGRGSWVWIVGRGCGCG